MIELGRDIKEIIRRPFTFPVVRCGFMGRNEIDATPPHAILEGANLVEFSSLWGPSLIPDSLVTPAESVDTHSPTLAIS